MIIPVEWLKQYIKTDKSDKEIASSFTELGLMLDSPIKGGTLNLEHRMDRSDWLSIVGCARDFAAFENIELKMPEIYTKEGKQGGDVKIEVKDAGIVRRFNTRVFKNIKVKESPEWLKERLTAYGMTPINNIVDITNYVMVELGNPMHAQDLGKFEKREIVIRKAREGEWITTLDGTEITLTESCFVLTQNDKPTVIGGIVGGLNTSVDFNTTEIILDAGNYDQSIVRKSSRELKIMNETVTRYDKFLHPKSTELSIARATKLILELAGGDYYENYDYYPVEMVEKEMKLRYSRITQFSGMEFESDKVEKILNSLGYTILESNSKSLKLRVPYFRTDIEVEDDIVADILRINGYSKIEASPIPSSPPKEITPGIYTFENKLRTALVKLQLDEHITDPLVGYSEAKNDQIQLDNALSSEKNALRTTIYETLFPVVMEYKKHNREVVQVFEIGKTYHKMSDAYIEDREAVVIYRGFQLDPYQNSKKIKEILYGLLKLMGVKNFAVKGNLIEVDGERVGELTYDHFTLDTVKLMNYSSFASNVISEFENMIYEDISLSTSLDKSAGAVIRELIAREPRVKNVHLLNEYFDIENNKKSVLIRLKFNERGITQEEINELKRSISN